jgi:hypothetical protein
MAQSRQATSKGSAAGIKSVPEAVGCGIPNRSKFTDEAVSGGMALAFRIRGARMGQARPAWHYQHQNRDRPSLAAILPIWPSAIHPAECPNWNCAGLPGASDCQIVIRWLRPPHREPPTSRAVNAPLWGSSLNLAPSVTHRVADGALFASSTISSALDRLHAERRFTVLIKRRRSPSLRQWRSHNKIRFVPQARALGAATSVRSNDSQCD